MVMGTYLDLTDAAGGFAKVEWDGWGEGVDVFDLGDVDGLDGSVGVFGTCPGLE